MAAVLTLIVLLFPYLAHCQPYSFVTDPSSESQQIYVTAEEGNNVSLYCSVLNVGAGMNGEYIRTTWQSKRAADSDFETVPFASGVSTGPDYLIAKIVVTEPFGTRTNFTLLNFTADLNMISFRCGQVNEDARFFTLGLPVSPSLLSNVFIQTVVEGEDITINLQSIEGGPDAFPPLISLQLSYNGNPLSNNEGMISVNDYNVSFTNVQRNQSGTYTLTVSNDAGGSNSTFILNVLFSAEATLLGPNIQYIQSGSSVAISLFANVSGNPIPTVTWTGPNNDTIITGGRFTVNNMTGVLSITGFTSDDNGTYTSIVGNGIGSPLVSAIQLILAVPPGPPIGLSVSNITDTSVRLDWSLPINLGTPPLTYYWVIMNPTPPPDVSLNATDASLLVYGIIPGTYYSVAVAAVAIDNALNGSLEGLLSNTTAFTTLFGAPVFESVDAIAVNGYINVSWTFRHTGGQEIDDIEVLCNATGEGRNLYDTFSCDINKCSISNLMGSTNLGPVAAGLSYCCRITAINRNGTDSTTIRSTASIRGIPSSPLIISTTIIPGLIILRFSTLFPGDTNISFIVNITDSESLTTSVSDQFTNYQSNSVVSINISIPNGGLISISTLTLNQYGASNETMIEGFLNVPPSPIVSTSKTTVIYIVTSTVIISTPTVADEVSSGLSSGSIAGIAITGVIVTLIIIIMFFIIIIQHVYIKKVKSSTRGEVIFSNKTDISTIPSVPNEAYATIDPLVNVQENVSYSSLQPNQQGSISESRTTGSTTAVPAVYETIRIENTATS